MSLNNNTKRRNVGGGDVGVGVGVAVAVAVAGSGCVILVFLLVVLYLFVGCLVISCNYFLLLFVLQLSVIIFL